MQKKEDMNFNCTKVINFHIQKNLTIQIRQKWAYISKSTYVSNGKKPDWLDKNHNSTANLELKTKNTVTGAG